MMAKPSGGRRSAKDRALEYVKSQILSGVIPGGELISEGEVATTLGMSRTPVREAFLRLEADGLLRLYPQRGALVVPVSSAEARAVIEARLVLEEFAATKVIAKGQTACLSTYERLSVAMRRQHVAAAAADANEFVEADRAFHDITLAESDNAILSDFYSSLRDRQMRMIGESMLHDERRMATILGEHLEIAEALRAGDSKGTSEAIRKHLRGTLRSLGLAAERD